MRFFEKFFETYVVDSFDIFVWYSFLFIVYFVYFFNQLLKFYCSIWKNKFVKIKLCGWIVFRASTLNIKLVMIYESFILIHHLQVIILRKGICIVGKFSWKDRGVGNFDMKLEIKKFESSGRSWKIQPKLKSHWWRWKGLTREKDCLFSARNSPSSFQLSNFSKNFQTAAVLSNFGRNFPTSPGSFRLKQNLSNLKLSNSTIFTAKLFN